MSTYYEDLGISREATLDEIKTAWRAKALQHHTDHNGNADDYRRCRLAYDVLSDPERRAAYDRAGFIDPAILAGLIEAADRELGEVKQAVTAFKEGRYFDVAEHALGTARRAWSRIFKPT